MLYVMQKDLGNVDDLIKEGKLCKVTAWLREKIHRHGSMYKPGELFSSVCGKFDAKYYTDYLKEKYSALYGF
jgi:carboxypeptidase Taq